MLIPVEISSFAIDPVKSTPLVILKESGGGSRTVAIPVDPAVASTIAMHSLQMQTDKPFTVDLVKIAVEQLDGVIHRAVVSDVSEGAFSACVVIRAGTALKVINCRTSDAIALAVKSGAPIFVKDTVFSKLNSESGLSEAEQLRARVRAVDTADFGRYVLE